MAFASLHAPRARTPYDRPFATGLHALRGVAAIIVVVGHVFASMKLETDFLTAIASFANGGAAVSLFFVLSGTVLAIALKDFDLCFEAYTLYAVRRLFRLVPLVVVASLIGYAYATLADRPAADGSVPHLTTFFHANYATPVDLPRLLASFVGYSAMTDPPLWSIFVEIMASLLIPLFLVFAASRTRLTLLIGLLAVVSFLVWPYGGDAALKYKWPVFLVNFAVGISVCWWSSLARPVVMRLPEPVHVGLLAGLFLLLMETRDLVAYRGHGDPLANLAETAVAAVLIALLLERCPRLPGGRLALALGDLSYGIYLLHFPIMHALITATAIRFGAKWPADLHALLVLGTTLVATLALARLTFRFVEKPGITMGRKITLARPAAI